MKMVWKKGWSLMPTITLLLPNHILEIWGPGGPSLVPRPFCLFFAERVRNKSTEKIRDLAGIRTQDLLNTSQTLLQLSHLDPWQDAEDKLHKQHWLEESAEWNALRDCSPDEQSRSAFQNWAVIGPMIQNLVIWPRFKTRIWFVGSRDHLD